MTDINIKNIVKNLVDTFLYAGEVSIDLRKKGLTKKIKSDNKVLTIDFDNLCTKPDTEFKKICKFLCVKSQKNLKSYLLRANLPRKIDYKERNKKYEFILKKNKDTKLSKSLNDEIDK